MLEYKNEIHGKIIITIRAVVVNIAQHVSFSNKVIFPCDRTYSSLASCILNIYVAIIIVCDEDRKCTRSTHAKVRSQYLMF